MAEDLDLPSDFLDKALGPLAIGTWQAELTQFSNNQAYASCCQRTNYCLYTIELSQAWSYFATYPNDPLVLRGSVILALIVDTIGTISNSYGIYNISVKHFGDPMIFATKGPEIYLYCITAGLSSLICHAYLTWRFFRFSKNPWISALLMGTAAVRTAFALFTGNHVISKNELPVMPVIVWLTLDVASDVAIAAALVFFLLRYRSDALNQTKSLLFKLIVTAIESGSVSSLITTVVLITYFTEDDSNVPLGIGYNLGRVYTLTLLFNLNMRKSGLLAMTSSERNAGAKGSVFTFNVGGNKAGTGIRSTGGVQDAISMVPIQVRHEVQIHTEGGRDDDDEVRHKSDDTESEHEKVSTYRSPV